ncbi:MAG: glycosyltransferase family 9 protein [Verrucomicrobia bacterium]|nr:glycosyltransferase family 9 protein [Verrucomicrobiota bacterium]
MRLLCIKVAARGDLLLSAPAFRMLRNSRPKAHITLLVGASCRDVAQHLPYFDEIRTLDDKALMAGGRWEQIREAWRLFDFMRQNYSRKKRGLKDEEGGEVCIFHRDWRYAFLARMAGVPVRKGFCGKGGMWFLTHAYHAGEREHHVSQYRGMVSMGLDGHALKDGALGSGASEIHQGKDCVSVPSAVCGAQESLAGVWKFEEGEKERALAVAAKHGFRAEGKSWVALGFGGGCNVKTRTDLKTWPLEHYRVLATHLTNQGRAVVWIGDVEDASLLGDPPIGVNLAGRLTVAETASVLSVCALAVSNDTLILHLAEALNVPVIGIFGPTDPSHYRPLGMRSAHLWLGESLPCSPCHRDGFFPPCKYQHRCMRDLSVESILKKIEGML